MCMMSSGVISMEGYQQSTPPTIKRLLELIQTMTSMLGSPLPAIGNIYEENSDKSPPAAGGNLLVLINTREFISGSMVSGEI